MIQGIESHRGATRMKHQAFSMMPSARSCDDSRRSYLRPRAISAIVAVDQPPQQIRFSSSAAYNTGEQNPQDRKERRCTAHGSDGHHHSVTTVHLLTCTRCHCRPTGLAAFRSPSALFEQAAVTNCPSTNASSQSIAIRTGKRVLGFPHEPQPKIALRSLRIRTPGFPRNCPAAMVIGSMTEYENCGKDICKPAWTRPRHCGGVITRMNLTASLSCFVYTGLSSN